MQRYAWYSGAKALAGILLLMLSISIASSAVFIPPTYAQEEGRGKLNKLGGGIAEAASFPASRLLGSVLSGRMWLMAEGLDPSLSSIIEGREVFVSPGVDSRLGGQPLLQGPSAAGALVPFRSPAPAFSRNILVSRDFSTIPFQTEPHIAVDPANPDHLLVGLIDYNFPSVSAYVSLDGGATWEGPKQAKYLSEDLGTGGDPTVAFDREGRAYFGSISIGVEEYRVGPIVGEEVVSSIVVARSDDGGFSWSEPISVARSGIFPGGVTEGPDGVPRQEYIFAFLDKPWMTVGPDKDDPSRDAVYVTYTEFAVKYQLFFVGELIFFGNPVLETTIKLVKGKEGGTVWSAPLAVSPTVTRTFGVAAGHAAQVSKRVLQGSQPAVAPDGTVYVAWLDSLDDGSMEGAAEIHVARSDDGGRTWTKPMRAAIFGEVWFTPRNANFRYWGSSFPQIAIGPGGEVYIVYTARPADRGFDDGDIYIVRSFDRGETWTLPRRINDDETDRLQFFPAVAVDPKGVVHAMWGDMRDDPAETKYHIYYSRSEDRGETWGFEIKEIGQRVGSTRVSDSYSNPNFGFPGGRFIGDYFAIKASSEDVYMVWADTRLGEFAGLNQKIGFARMRPIKSPGIFISPPTGAGGRDVTIRGLGFQPDSTIFIEVDGSAVATSKTDSKGEFNLKLFMPLTSEGSHQVIAFDQSGNFAPASFFIDFGFDTVKKTIEERIAALEERLSPLAQIDQQSILAELRSLKESIASLKDKGDGSGGIETMLITAVGALAAGLAAGSLLALKRVRRAA